MSNGLGPIKSRNNVTGDAKDSAFAMLDMYARRKMRCGNCDRVCGFIEKNGRCGSPKCMIERAEERIDQISLENRDLDNRLTKLEENK